MRTTIVLASALAALSFTACKKKAADEKSASSDSPAAASAKPVPPPSAEALAKKACSDWGYEGKGDFGEPCKVKGAGPFVMTWTGTYKSNAFGEEVPLFKVESKFDRDITWANVSTWHYDKAGTLLEVTGMDGSKFKRAYQNGNHILDIKAGATGEFAIGQDKKYIPAGTETIVSEITGWGWGEEPKLFFSAHDGIDLTDRPKDGWK